MSALLLTSTIRRGRHLVLFDDRPIRPTSEGFLLLLELVGSRLEIRSKLCGMGRTRPAPIQFRDCRHQAIRRLRREFADAGCFDVIEHVTQSSYRLAVEAVAVNDDFTHLGDLLPPDYATLVGEIDRRLRPVAALAE